MNPERPTDPDSDRRNWLAFQFVSGDLSPTEEQDFELWLASDQGAREAVAEAVRLAGVVGASVERKTWTRRPLRLAVASLTLAAAAGLAAMLVNPGRPISEAPASPAESLALAWSGLRDGEAASPRDDQVATLEPSSDPAVIEPDDDAPPTWLIEAARLRNEPNSEGHGS